MAKVKVLFLAANPAGTVPLKLDEEIRQITAKVRASEHRDSLELVSQWAVRPDDLLQALLEVKPQVVHFSGHGTAAAELRLLDAQGNSKLVSREALIHLFTTLRDNVRVIVLNACYTRPQAEALAEIIDCTIGMNRAIGDEAAIVFAASFYRAIGFGRSVREAFELGRAALLLESIPEDETPELHVRDGVDPSALTLVSPAVGPVVNEVPPQVTTAANPTIPLPPMERLTLVKTLAALSPTTFDTLIAAIPKAAQHISRQGTIPEKAAELIRWAESPPGCGLPVIEKTLRVF
jgi:hypothetical protein